MGRALNPDHLDLFGARETEADKVKRLNQYMTPCWAAEALWDQYFSDLPAGSVIWEPTCGRGALLRAVPDHMVAIGSEIDPVLADEARRATGRTVITADVRDVELDLMPTAVFANPPFAMKVVDAILEKSRHWLPMDGRAGFVLPAYALQTPSRVTRYSEHWSIQADLLPRTVFPRLESPLIFAMFRKDLKRTLVGFALVRETASIEQMSKQARDTLMHAPQTWRAAVEQALQALGGRAKLSEIYCALANRRARPSDNQWWQAKTRQILQQHFRQMGPGEYALAA